MGVLPRGTLKIFEIIDFKKDLLRSKRGEFCEEGFYMTLKNIKSRSQQLITYKNDANLKSHVLKLNQGQIMMLYSQNLCGF